MDEPIIDDVEARELFETQTGGDPGFYRELVTTQLEEGEKLLDQLSDAMADGDHKSFCRAAHTLKGSAKTFGLPRLRVISSALEEESRAAIPADAAGRVSDLKAIYFESMEALKVFASRID